ncbi:MAG: N-acetyl-gamma-glutamyl-phosphate reductase [Pseudomonadota bacterium]|nr:N-acetyl-gamma-glutamyl-phosphate reductase [Pseudomonadota bacterium]
MLKAVIIGATGYTGQELLRLLANHSKVTVTAVTSRGEAGKPLTDLFPQFFGHYDDLVFIDPDDSRVLDCDVVFFATPHGTAHKYASQFLEAGLRVIDLSADFRIKDQTLWERWYGQPHGAPEYIEQAVYGLVEHNRDALKGAQLIAVPGCYPTAVQLAILPALKTGLVAEQSIIADCKTGVSGGGRKASLPFHVCEASESMKPYALAGHRHEPEIEQGTALFGQQATPVTFMPHLAPMIRGIEATCYLTLTGETDWQAVYEQAYSDQHFVKVLAQGQAPETRHVRGSNFCQLSVMPKPEKQQLVVFSVIDNLVKGAAGQAIQCFNVSYSFDEYEGINSIAMVP